MANEDTIWERAKTKPQHHCRASNPLTIEALTIRWWYIFLVMFLCGVLLVKVVFLLRSDHEYYCCWCTRVDAHSCRLAMNLPYCVPILVYNIVQPDAQQLDRYHKSFKILEVWKANAASKNDHWYCVSTRGISVRVKWSLEVLVLTWFIEWPWSNI